MRSSMVPRMPSLILMHRWLYSMPSWFTFGSAAATCFLFLCDRFQWLPFNCHKGWTVLIAVASTAALILIWLLCLVFALVYRLRFQFSVGFLLAAPVVVALPLGWLAAELRKARQQGRVVEEIRKSATEVSYDWQVNSDGFPQLDVACPRPAWLPTSLNDDFFGNVVAVTLEDGPFLDHALRNLSSLPRLQCFVLPFSNVTDDQLEPLRALTKLRVVVLSSERITGSAIMYLDGMDRLECLHLESTSVTDAGLSHLAALKELRVLGLESTKITDAGLVYVGKLGHLTSLDISGNRVTDRGLVHLGGLTDLTYLRLGETAITDDGFANLSALHQIANLGLDETRVTDASLEIVGRMTHLTYLNLRGTRVTDAGLAHLSCLSQLATLDLSDTRVTDEGLRYLSGLANLRQLRLGQKVSDDGIKNLKKDMPNCKIGRR